MNSSQDECTLRGGGGARQQTRANKEGGGGVKTGES